MPQTGRRDLVANRWEPFKHRVRFEGVDLTGAAFEMEVRDRRDGGFVRAALGNAASISAEGVRLESVANEDVDFGGDIGIVNAPVSTIHIRINEATMEAMGEPSKAAGAEEAGKDGCIFYDLQITASAVNDGVKYRAIEGEFIIKAGSTGSGS